jgi:hypothetical protein
VLTWRLSEFEVIYLFVDGLAERLHLVAVPLVVLPAGGEQRLVPCHTSQETSAAPTG